MNPGSIIEWVYMDIGVRVLKDEHLWSSVLNRWVPIGDRALVIGDADGTITWLSGGMLFHARREDGSRRRRAVFPRAMVVVVR